VRLALGRKRVAAVLVVVVVVTVATLFVLTAARPRPVVVPAHTGDLVNGEMLFHAGSCQPCHKPAEDADGAMLPSGGAPFPTPVGTFYPQNLTPDPETGIGRWTEVDFVVAMTQGVSPDKRHYFPAFPYIAFAAMPIEDLLDLRAYLFTLPAVRSPNREPDLPMVWLARRSVGLWKTLAFKAGPFESDPQESASWNRGAYLVHGPGHCGECHTPRNALFALDESRSLAGAPHPAGEGEVPSVRDLIGRGRYTDASDLTLALMFGETFGYEKLSSGGMAEVQMNLGRLPEAEVQAMSEYLVSLPPLPGVGSELR
jgi:mono/diheme cytochrome c family protein